MHINANQEQTNVDESRAEARAEHSNNLNNNSHHSTSLAAIPTANSNHNHQDGSSGNHNHNCLANNHSSELHNAIPNNNSPQVASPSNAPTAALDIQLASIHSLHPQRDLRLNNRFQLLPSNDQIRELQTVLRDRSTNRGDFKFFSDRLIRLVVEEGLNQLPIEREEVTTPTGHIFSGLRYRPGNCGVSIVRSGESMEQGLRDCCRSIRIGKILIESDENNQARVLYTKFPKDVAQRKILLLYPIMSTGLAVKESVKVLLGHGCREQNLILLNLFSSPRAAKMINRNFPNMSVLTSDISRICPNHYATRYFGTE